MFRPQSSGKTPEYESGDEKVITESQHDNPKSDNIKPNKEDKSKDHKREKEGGKQEGN